MNTWTSAELLVDCTRPKHLQHQASESGAGTFSPARSGCDPTRAPGPAGRPRDSAGGGISRGVAGSHKGHLASARAPWPADRGDTGKRRRMDGMAAAAPRNLRWLRASADCVQPQLSCQPGERRRHQSGFACHSVCRRTLGSSGRRPAQW